MALPPVTPLYVPEPSEVRVTYRLTAAQVAAALGLPPGVARWAETPVAGALFPGLVVSAPDREMVLYLFTSGGDNDGSRA